MFDFVNYTYSGILSVLSTLFGLAYPLVLGCIEKIDSKFGSTKLSERFMNEKSFKFFKVLLVINLIVAVLFPFLMDGSVEARIFIGIQSVFAICLVSSAIALFSKIITYYNASDLHLSIVNDYNHAISKNDKKNEVLYFTQWVDLSSVLLKSADNNLVIAVYEFLQKYVKRIYDDNKGKPCVFDQFYYEGISRINEYLSKGESKPISFNNGNTILTSLIFEDSLISDTTYRYLWRNLRIQLFYDKDEWIMEYWKTASQKMELYLDNYRYQYLDIEDSEISSLKAKQKQRFEFLEFHIMLCAMLVQQKKYELLDLMLSYTQSEPPIYPLVPSNLREILDIFNKINCIEDPFYYEQRYQMPNMHGITDGKIVGAANYFLALLVYRIYVIRWDYGYEPILNTGKLPDTLSELCSLRRNLDVFVKWLDIIVENQPLLNAIRFRSFNEKRFYFEDGQDKNVQLDPKKIIFQLQKEIDSKMENLRVNQPLDGEKIKSEENLLIGNIIKAMKPYQELYQELLDERFSQEKCYFLDSSVTMPFPNTAFVTNPDVSHSEIAGCMSSYMLRSFYHYFASSFNQEHNKIDYTVSSEDLFLAIDALGINNEHYIIAFGIYFDYYLGKIDSLKKLDSHKYCYKGINILSLNCNTEYFSQKIYVLRFDDRPCLKFHTPTQKEQQKYYLIKQNDLYNIWLSINKISDHPELLSDSIAQQLGDSAKQTSLFTAVWSPILYFKDEYLMICIKIKYRLSGDGKYDGIDIIKPFNLKEKTVKSKTDDEDGCNDKNLDN